MPASAGVRQPWGLTPDWPGPDSLNLAKFRSEKSVQATRLDALRVFMT